MTHNFPINPENKSRTHLALQRHLMDILPDGQAVMEKRFDEIGRIADVFWAEQNLLFEIQCSPMSRQEMLNRTEAYRSLGYQVVWILHEKSFNKFRLTSLEGAIQDIPHYFTNMSPGGEGVIYDQCCFISRAVRIKTWKRLPVDLSLPKRISLPTCCEKKERLQVVERRMKSWPLYFYQDLVSMDQGECNSSECEEPLAYERSVLMKKESLIVKLKRFYLSILHRALRGHCG